MPKQYDYLPMLLPIGLVQQLGWLTPLGSTVVGFMLIAMDKFERITRTQPPIRTIR